MKIRIKECVGNSRVYGADGKLAGTIEGWPKNGPVREICGTDGNVLYRIRKEKGGCVIEYGIEPQAKQEISIPFQYEDRKDRMGCGKGSGAAVLFRAPLAVKAVIPLTKGDITVHQNRKRDIVLEDNAGRIGRLTGVASLTGHEVECEKELDVYEAAVLFAVVEYMYHDDDIEVV